MIAAALDPQPRARDRRAVMGKPSENPMPVISAHTPVGEAVSAVLAPRLEEVATNLREFKGKGKGGKKDVHEVRVGSRRAMAALGVFEGLLDAKQARAADKLLNEIRKAAGKPRDLDVQHALLNKAARRARSAAARSALRELAKTTKKKRKESLRGLAKLAKKWPRKTLRREARALVEGLPEGSATLRPGEYAELAKAAMDREIGKVRQAAGADLKNLDRLHELRLELKQLRYTMEAIEGCLGPGWAKKLAPALEKVQKQMGGINDDRVLLESLREEKSDGGAGRARNHPLRVVIAELRKDLRRRHKAFLADWKRLISSGFLEQFRDELAVRDERPGLAPGAVASPPIASRVLRPISFLEPKPHGLNGTSHAVGHGKSRSTPSRRRLAAIDVGTNSIRLIVAEAQQDGSYRILDDEKEITRLGQGLGKTGKIDPGAIEHTAVTIQRMKSIAEGYGASGNGAIRVVGTSAAREASNTEVLAKQIHERTGLDLCVIPGEEEAMLAYRSVANAFDLAGVAGAVVDIGGGSTEIVLSAAVGPGADGGRAGLGGGVIERVYTLPIGAVRLTEMFGGPETCSRQRYEEMREYIKRELKATIGRPPIWPQLVVGTGGTLTTLGAMVLQRELGPTADGLFSGGVQGLEVARADLKHLLTYVRKLPVKDRTRVPGLSADRTDIIVAGLTIIDCVLKHLGSNRVRVHEGGIRDGILLSMVAGGADGEQKRDPMRAVRRLAKACGFEAAHSRHVTGLALSIFDQLREQIGEDGESPWPLPEGMKFDEEARLLLEGASLLHDVGYLINYAQHHKHSYHLIVHADLPGFTTRQVRVVANVARYHRAAEPKKRHANFAALAEADQGLVRGLSGILRVADGLDRTHMQSIRGVSVKLLKDAAMFEVDSLSEPSVDMWGAVRKGALFEESLGVRAHFEWKASEGLQASVEVGKRQRVGADMPAA
jgi:exopolyphosphatase/guanosine-5'-triphosphate,3'-diphosphate pyrophosphatase